MELLYYISLILWCAISVSTFNLLADLKKAKVYVGKKREILIKYVILPNVLVFIYVALFLSRAFIYTDFLAKTDSWGFIHGLFQLVLPAYILILLAGMKNSLRKKI